MEWVWRAERGREEWGREETGAWKRRGESEGGRGK